MFFLPNKHQQADSVGETTLHTPPFLQAILLHKAGAEKKKQIQIMSIKIQSYHTF